MSQASAPISDVCEAETIIPTGKEVGRSERQEVRKPTSVVGAIRLPDGTEIPCIVKDVSRSGAKLGIPGQCALPERFMFKMHNRHLVFSVKLAWRRDCYAGVIIERIAKLPGKPQHR